MKSSKPISKEPIPIPRENLVSLAGYLQKKIKGKASDKKIDQAIVRGWGKR